MQYADYAVWQRRVMRRDGAPFTATVDWWKSILSASAPATKLPFRRRVRAADLKPSEGVLPWKLEEFAAERLTKIARSAGATHFTVRLATFAALLADVTGSGTVVLGTNFTNRNRGDTQDIVGQFTNLALLVLHFDSNKTFVEWVKIVRDRVFETSIRGQLPYKLLCEELRTAGVEPPAIHMVFAMSSNHPDQHFGNLTISNLFWPVGRMPWECTVYVDERKPDNCRVDFDAHLYDSDEMRAMLDRYLRLLEATAREPELPMGSLLKIACAKPPRRTFSRFATALYHRIKRPSV